MTDLEITKLCAEAMGIEMHSRLVMGQALVGTGRGYIKETYHQIYDYDPLNDDAQAIALVKKFSLHIDQRPGKQISVQPPDFESIATRTDTDLNRAICLCVAQLQRRGL